MKILIIGANGYLGSNLAKALLKSGYQIAGLEQSTSPLHRIQEMLGSIEIFFLEKIDLDQFFAENAITCIVFAATNYQRDKQDFAELIRTNVEVPSKIISAAAKSVGYFINCDTILPPQTSPYALSKFHFKQWAELISTKEPINLWNVQLDQFYGPGEADIQFATRMIKACLRGETIALTGGEQLRDFIFIDDVVSGLTKLIRFLETQKPTNNQTIGIGTGKLTSVKEFVETIKKLTQSNSKLEFGKVPYRDGELAMKGVDIAFMTKLGWAAQTTLQQGLQMMIEHLQKFL